MLEDLLKDFSRYAREMRCAVRRGTAATQCAIVATLASAGALTVDGIFADPPGVTALLHAEAVEAAAEVCDKPIGEEVEARVRPADLTRNVVPLELDPKVCGKAAATLHVRRDWLLAVRESG